MGLFDKKYCDVCGAQIGLLGNRKLEDGNLCKDCAKKLSPWFTGRRHSTLKDIKDQLAKREENKAAVSSFVQTKKFGDASQALYLDGTKKNFAVCLSSDLKSGNPDIIPLSCVTDCKTETKENKSELKFKDKEGKMQSYVPAKYEYSYDFNVEIEVEHPYIDEIHFRLNSGSVKKTNDSNAVEKDANTKPYVEMGNELITALTGKVIEIKQDVPDKLKIALTDLPYTYTEQGIGSVTVKFGFTGEAEYAVKSEALYNVAVNIRKTDFNKELETAVKGAFAELILNHVNPEDILAKNDLVKEYVSKEMKKTEMNNGITVTSLTITPSLSETDKNSLRELAKKKLVAGLSSSSSASAETVSDRWFCPECGKENHGKFCVNCGTKRP